MSTTRELRLIEADDGGWAAVDEETGATGTGATREEALLALDAERSAPTDDVPLGDRLRGMAGDLDVAPVESVRDIREQTSRCGVFWTRPASSRRSVTTRRRRPPSHCRPRVPCLGVDSHTWVAAGAISVLPLSSAVTTTTVTT
jgi:hypothetical protein